MEPASSTSALSLKDGPYIVANGKPGFDDGARTDRSTPTAARRRRRRERLLHACQVPPGRRHRLQRREQLDPDDDLVEIGMWLAEHDERTRGLPDHEGRGARALVRRLRHRDGTEVEGIDWNGEDDGTSCGPATGSNAGRHHRRSGRPARAEAPGERHDGRPATRATTGAGLPAYLTPATATTGSTTAAWRARSRSSRSTFRDIDDDRPGLRAARRCPRATGSRRHCACRATLDFRIGASPRVTISDLVAGNFERLAEARRHREHRRAPAHRPGRRPERRLPERARQVPPVLGLHGRAAGGRRSSTSKTSTISFDGLAARRRQVHHRRSSVR